MKKSCAKCGRIHDKKYICVKPNRVYKQDTEADKFRHSRKWNEKSTRIKQRDNYLCQACIRNIEGTIRKLNYTDIEVHHIEPLNERYDLRLDDDNLIALCSHHHEMAEHGEINKSDLKSMISPRG